ncbi:AraC family transcriptional regulator [Paenibacillus sp. MBLB2552]|uniref:AraC family transcriptional regulator n=1 Tax=Paenibacillus mellifer TaxID=2937794 RepID=A0A9X2BQ59_9BACL|nr:AraC family transcriptional regulator [Paenibacillus mellifer]MCK8488749.1 AraC family transcriptional regulator [Paenibacillus mellifer]
MNPEHDWFEVYMNPDDRERDVTVLFSGQGRPHPNHRIGPSVHDYFLLHTVFEGKGTYTWGGRIYSCGPGDTFVIFPNGLFTYEADSRYPWHYAWVALKGPSVLRQLKDVGITPDKPVVGSGEPEQLRKLYARLRSSFRQTDHPQLESLEAVGWMTLLFHQFGVANREHLPRSAAKEPAMIDRQVEQAIRWFQLQYSQQIGIEELSRNLGYHRAHLFNAFKARTGLSPKQYLTKIRIDKAKELLAGPLTIDQIASSVGFNDALYFSRQFKKSTGMSPSEYRSGGGRGLK